MNSRERVLDALNHKEPDRVPFDMGGTVITGIHYKAYAALRDYLGLPKREPKIIDMIQQLALVEDDVMARLGVDMKNISPRSSAQLQYCRGRDGRIHPLLRRVPDRLAHAQRRRLVLRHVRSSAAG